MKPCPHDSYPAYKELIGPIRRRARQLGYAIGVHGTLKRDIDLIACPWTRSAVQAHVLAHAIMEVAAEFGPCKIAFLAPDESTDYRLAGAPGAKAHQRLGWVIHLGGGPAIDLSVMPRVQDMDGPELVASTQFGIPSGTVCRREQADLNDFDLLSLRATRIPKQIVSIKQKHPRGCGIACLAMVTHQTYDEVAAHLADADLENKGIYDNDITAYLEDRGFATMFRGMIAGGFYGRRERKPWPCQPFSEVHICNVRVHDGAPCDHNVVMLEDGTVLDPLESSPKRLTDYYRVNNVLGIFRV